MMHLIYKWRKKWRFSDRIETLCAKKKRHSFLFELFSRLFVMSLSWQIKEYYRSSFVFKRD
jgi:hypothetical protein